jgi:hypothetical protein
VKKQRMKIVAVARTLLRPTFMKEDKVNREERMAKQTNDPIPFLLEGGYPRFIKWLRGSQSVMRIEVLVWEREPHLT